ncbi:MULTISPECIES: carbamoyltransferase HypF [Streptomyces]|uniref:Carbamoyltransferase n=1 Tax=Streptomyces demainii TaxID=588122 RepID=A0ABT9L5F7_9ACTN|nr:MULTISPECIES: carbamoyltransferase HypF [Streptomyces]MDN3058153.1 carbamoyltransferase HypF [Streptomyces sp. SRF1]MDP9615908.1 hydrogenase maturation protein HypF [Streptomyces demainii]
MTAVARPLPVRRLVAVGGVVQGVGFRPFVHALATELGLSGQVANGPDGARIEIEGGSEAVAAFCHRLTADAPALADIVSVATSELLPTGGTGFAIVPTTTGDGRTLVPPDAATCDACLTELTDPADRRHRHPFITCTDCGPRFTITTAMPYDRATTTMAAFPMCPDCAAEYTDPSDRRFHAQPIACWACGPRLRLTGTVRRTGGAALAEARRMLAAGAIVAVKGIGGYHLVCDAAAPRAVGELRRRKARGDKPFAVMIPDPGTAARLGHLGPAERRLLTGRARPIVLLRRRSPSPLAPQVCPGSPDIGVLLPYTPLHRLLFGLPGDPPGPHILVVTSGNLSGEPLVTDDREGLRRLDGLADAWLWHDRPIAVACDDSVVRVRNDGSTLPIRRSRGFAPARIRLPVAVRPVLAVGGDMKNTLCLAEGDAAWLSAHVGDLNSPSARRAFARAENHLRELTRVEPVRVAADRHPGYRSARWARRDGRPLTLVQHHHAHIASAMAEHQLDEPVLGIAFDGTGYGDDGAVWGGEVLLADYAGYRRLAHLSYVPLPGGDAAVRHPYRMALAHLRAAGVAWSPDLPCVAACPPGELRLLEAQLARGVACVPTSSMGRLFDAVSSLVGVCHRAGYEAQAAVELEAAAVAADGVRNGYAFALEDPAPLLGAVVADLRAGTAVPLIAARFHLAVAGAVRAACRKARRSTGVRTVVLTGGVFANALLDGMCSAGLAEDGFTVLGHTVVPPGDGGLALGQAVVAARVADD